MLKTLIYFKFDKTTINEAKPYLFKFLKVGSVSMNEKSAKTDDKAYNRKLADIIIKKIYNSFPTTSKNTIGDNKPQKT